MYIENDCRLSTSKCLPVSVSASYPYIVKASAFYSLRHILIGEARGDGRQMEATPLAHMPNVVPAPGRCAPEVAAACMNLIVSPALSTSSTASDAVYELWLGFYSFSAIPYE